MTKLNTLHAKTEAKSSCTLKCKYIPVCFDCEDSGYIEPEKDGSKEVVSVDPKSERLQLLDPFLPIGREIKDARLLIKAHGKCTTDHISMAGPWLRYRGHLDNISNNCLIGAVNSFNMKTNFILSSSNAIANLYNKYDMRQTHLT